jgi:uncharacterized protein YndB with AHSA1/START domain
METSTIIDAPSKLVWEVLIDTQCWSRWGPSVNAVRCRDRFIQSGSKGSVRTAVGIWIPFEITDFVPGKRWSWRVMNIRATGHRVEYLAINQCRLIFEVPWFAAPYILICKIAARRIKLIVESIDYQI